VKRPNPPQPTRTEILATIRELREAAQRLMQQASELIEKAAKLEDALGKGTKD
jgi:hypothetical protein